MEYMNEPDYFREKIDVVSIIMLVNFSDILFQNLNPIKNEEKIKSYFNDVLEGLDYVHSSSKLFKLKLF